jgi:hypothetical protein
MPDLLRRAAEAQRSSKYVALHEDGDVDWEAVGADAVALANSGGGVIVLPHPSDAIAERIAQIAGEAPELSLHELERNGRIVDAVVVGRPESPLTFGPENIVLVRHGARSTAATAKDLRAFVERRLRDVRKHLLSGVRTALAAPPTAEIVAIERTHDELGELTRIRITTDDAAPLFGRIDPDLTHPYRQKELIAHLNAKLGGAITLNQHDLLSVRRSHGIDDESHPEFAHRPKFGNLQYSEDFVDWILDQYARDPRFFAKARARYSELRHSD